MIIPLDNSKGEFEEQDLQYIKLLEIDKNFEEIIQKSRLEYHIDKPLQNYPTGEIYNDIDKYTRNIVNLYGLPDSWIASIRDFIAFNKFYSPGKGINLSGMSFRHMPTRRNKKFATNLEIVITQKMSLDTLYKWIRTHKKILREHINTLPPRNTHQSSDFKLRLKIFEMYNQGLKPKQISEQLAKKYPNNKYVLAITPSAVSDFISDLKKIIKRI